MALGMLIVNGDKGTRETLRKLGSLPDTIAQVSTNKAFAESTQQLAADTGQSLQLNEVPQQNILLKSVHMNICPCEDLHTGPSQG